MGQTDNKFALDQAMAWQRTCDNIPIEPMPAHYTDEYMRHQARMC